MNFRSILSMYPGFPYWTRAAFFCEVSLAQALTKR
jgi:hypothetical protein